MNVISSFPVILRVMVKSVAAQGIFTCMSDKTYYSAVLKKKQCTLSLQHCSAWSKPMFTNPSMSQIVYAFS
jgi:hypothetical protein